MDCLYKVNIPAICYTHNELDNEDFYNTYYIADSIIGLKELTGIHYYNNSFIYGEKENYDKAISQLEKAFFLYDSELIKLYLKYYLATKINMSDDLGKGDVFCENLMKYIAYHDSIVELRTEIREVYKSKVSYSLEKNDVQTIEEVEACLKESLEDDSLKAGISEVSYLLLANYYYRSAKFDKALEYLATIYTPDKINLNLVVRECMAKKFAVIYNPDDGLDTLKKYAEIFPFINKDEALLGFKAWCMLKKVYTHFELNESEEGVAALNAFRETFAPEDKVKYPESNVGSGYGAASSYYVRKNDYKKAEALLKEGLEYSSYNIELQRKLKLLYETYPELEDE